MNTKAFEDLTNLDNLSGDELEARIREMNRDAIQDLSDTGEANIALNVAAKLAFRMLPAITEILDSIEKTMNDAGVKIDERLKDTIVMTALSALPVIYGRMIPDDVRTPLTLAALSGARMIEPGVSERLAAMMASADKKRGH